MKKDHEASIRAALFQAMIAKHGCEDAKALVALVDTMMASFADKEPAAANVQ